MTITGLLRPLTPRQRDVAQLAAKGLGLNEMASELGVSFGAIRMHVNAIADLLDNPRLLTPLRLVRGWAIEHRDRLGA